MKKHFNNRQLAHVWAQQSQPDGRGSNMFFDGASIYSYGRHFEIARFVTRKGERAVLLTTRRYSVTTSRHVGYVCGALYGLPVPVFHVPDIDAAARGDTADNATRDYYRAAVAESVRKVANARSASSKDWEMTRAQELAAEANAYAEFMGRRWRIKAPEFAPEYLEALRAKVKREAQRKADATKALQAKIAAEHAERSEQWRKGELASVGSHPCWRSSTMLRLTPDRSEIETSRGARIPTSAARLVWDAVQTCRAEGREWEPEYDDRPRLGQFTLDKVEACGDIVAGCHVIKYDELARMAVRLGFES